MMKFIYTFLFAVLAYASEKKEIQINSHVEIGSALPLMLEDLISSPKVIPVELLNIELPFGGNVLSQKEFLDWMKENKERNRELNSFLFKVPLTVQIERAVALSRDQISKRAQNRLALKCQDCEFRLQLTNIPAITGENNRLEWRDLPVSGPFMMPITSADGNNLGWIRGQIRTEKPILKTARVLRIGDTITDEDLKIERVDISFNKDYFSDKNQVIGKKVSRSLASQSNISSGDLQRNYDVKQGQTVRVISGNENFEVGLQAVAQDSGVMGDLIRIRNVVNQKIMSGRIIDVGLVRIE